METRTECGQRQSVRRRKEKTGIVAIMSRRRVGHAQNACASAFVSPRWSGQDPSVVRAQSCLSVVVLSMLVSCSVRVAILMVPTSRHTRYEPHYWMGGGWELPYLRCSAPMERFHRVRFALILSSSSSIPAPIIIHPQHPSFRSDPGANRVGSGTPQNTL